MTDYYFHDNDPIDERMRRSREELNELTFIRDYGVKATGVAFQALGATKFFEQVSKQRAQMRLDGHITMGENGHEQRSAKIDLVAMGLEPATIERIEALAAAERGKPKAPQGEILDIAEQARDHRARVADRRTHRTGGCQEI